jgi:hypothetical protein
LDKADLLNVPRFMSWWPNTKLSSRLTRELLLTRD